MFSPDVLRRKIRFLRTKKELTQNQVAKKLSLSLRTYQRLENGKSPLDVQTLFILSRILEISFVDLTNPKLNEKDLQEIEFYQSQKEIYERAKVTGQTVETLTKLLTKVQSYNLGITKVEEDQHFTEAGTPIFLTDLKKTAKNPAFKSLQKKDPQAHFKTTLRHWKASEICLKKDYAGFSNNNHYMFVLPPVDDSAPVILGFQKGS